MNTDQKGDEERGATATHRQRAWRFALAAKRPIHGPSCRGFRRTMQDLTGSSERETAKPVDGATLKLSGSMHF
jgi:hypothetical protein